MAFSRWVVKASPPLLLGKIGSIGLLSALAGRIAFPQAVAKEVGAGDDGRTTLGNFLKLETPYREGYQSEVVDHASLHAERELHRLRQQYGDLAAGGRKKELPWSKRMMALINPPKWLR